jgi:hypothetical protein
MTGPDDRLGRLQSLLGQGGDDLASLERLCVACVEHLSMSGAGISVVTGSGHRDVLFATDDVSARIEELQLSLGEGPCIDAWAQRAPVLEPDLESTPGRWPMFGPAAVAAGAAAVLALPLDAGQTHVGALDVYRDTPGGLSEADVKDALRLGDVMTQVLLRHEPARLDTQSPPAEGGPPFTAEVYQAAGMITVQLDMDITEALARLRAHAYAEERPLREVARDVVARRLRLERDG